MRDSTQLQLASTVRVETPVEPNAAEHKGWRSVLLMTIVCLAVALLCLLVIFRVFFQSRFDLTLSDPVDGRFCVAILEHWHNVFQGKTSLSSPPFFYPERDVLGYSDAFFLYAPAYSAARSLGCDPYLALELTMMCVTLVGFLSMFYVLGVVLRFTHSTALLGASLFVTLNAYYIHLVHPHLASVVFIPVLWCLAAKYWQAANSGRWEAHLYICAFAIVLASLLFTSFYIGWFTIFAAFSAILIFTGFQVIAERSLQSLHTMATALFALRLDAAIGGLTFILSMIPFLIIYLPALRRTGTRPFQYTFSFILPALGALDVGPDNLPWGRMSAAIEHIIGPNGIREHPTGWPLITLCVFLGTTLWCAHRLRSTRSGSPIERRSLHLQLAVSLTCIMLWFSAIRIGSNMTPWWILWKIVPGAAAIRIPPRINLVLNVGVVIVCMFGIEELRRAMARYPKGGYAVAVLLGMCLFAEQLNFMPTHLVSRSSEAKKFSRITKPPPVCSEFYVSSWSVHRQSILAFQVDAMLVAEKLGIPTLNGYSSWFPADWDLLNGTKRRIAEDASDWVQRHGLPHSLCALDMPSGSWSIATVSSNPQLGQPLPQAITNPGFESGSATPWLPSQVTARLTSERAHRGAHSIAEESGDGSVYQDIKGLQPGQTYNVSAWVSGSPDSTATAQIAIFDPGSNVASFSSSRNPGSRWELLTESFTVSQAGTTRIHLVRKQGSGTLYWDDVQLYLDD